MPEPEGPPRDAPAVSLRVLPDLRRRLRLQTHDPARDLVSARIHAEHIWEPFETRLWLAAQRPGDLVVDVGANLGYFALLSACCIRRPERVFAFEPDPDNFRLLEHNLRAHGVADEVEAVPAALAAREGKGHLRLGADNLGDHQIYAGDGERRTVPVRLLRGADYLAPRAGRIDLLKIDTQGSEDAVLEGLWPILERSRADLRILVELTPFSLALAGRSGRGLVERLAALDLPMAIVDHVEQRLVASDAAALATWCDNVAATPGDRGFMNIFVGVPPAL